MIEPLTKEKLIEYGFENNVIERLLTWDNYEHPYYKGEANIFFASNSDQKIYSGNDAGRKIYFKEEHISFPECCIDLIPEYYTLRLARYLEMVKEESKVLYNEAKAVEKFKKYEILLTEKYLKDNEKFKGFSIIESKYRTFEYYLDWLQDDAKPIKEQKIEAPTMKLFCAIIHYSNVLIKDEEESPEAFANRVKEKYAINCNPERVRQNFRIGEWENAVTKKDQKKYLGIITKQILPLLEPAAKQQIENYIKSKNLYA